MTVPKPGFDPIGWMASHQTMPKLLMLLLMLGGLLSSYSIKKEFLPSRQFPIIEINIDYPGATPAEIEQSILVPIENALSDLDGLKELRSEAHQGSGFVAIELQLDADKTRLLQDVQQRVSSISHLPQNMEKPMFRLASDNAEVLEVVISGDIDNFSLNQLVQRIKGWLVSDPRLQKVEINGLPGEELHINVYPEKLEALGLSLSKVAERVRQETLELSAGELQIAQQKLLLTVNQRKFWADDFRDIAIISDASGDLVYLQDIAEIKEGFSDSAHQLRFNGSNGVLLNIYRSGSQSPTDIEAAFLQQRPEIEAMLPPGVSLDITDNDANTYRNRVLLLLKNAFIGLVLVLCVLTLFLEHRLAFWVMLSIPTCFLGAMLFLPSFGVSINVISIFGFIIALGIVVDDAIIAGENIFAARAAGLSYQEAAKQGAIEIAEPVSFAILTNIVAFLPLLYLPGSIGQIFGAIPIVVILCFLISWFETLFLLPGHLSRLTDKKITEPSWLGKILLQIRAFAHGNLMGLKDAYVHRYLVSCLAHPWRAVFFAMVFLSLALTWPLSGRMNFVLFPEMEGEWATATITMPSDTSRRGLMQIQQKLETAGLAAVARSGGDKLMQSYQAEIEGANIEVGLYLTPVELRPITSHELVRRWRAELGDVPGANGVSFDAERGGGPGGINRLELELKHRETEVLQQVIKTLKAQLVERPGVVDLSSSFDEGVMEWEFKLNELGRSLGFSAASLADQFRALSHGEIALRYHRNQSEVSVLVRLNKQALDSRYDMEQLRVQAPSGAYVELMDIMALRQHRTASQIQRKDGVRTEFVYVYLEDNSLLPPLQVWIEDALFPSLLPDYPLLSLGFSGREEEKQDSSNALLKGALMSLLVIYLLLSIPLRSYGTPLLVMTLIPFAWAGAILGHELMGLTLSIVSVMGVFALMGIVVNDSLILLTFAEHERTAGADAKSAIASAASRRFRPIFLTTLTTAVGLSPMMFETSRDAMMMTPMAVSLGFGIVVTTSICLLVLPALYVLLPLASRKPNLHLETVVD